MKLYWPMNICAVIDGRAHRETRAGICSLDLCCYDFTQLTGFHQLFTKQVRSESVLPF